MHRHAFDQGCRCPLKPEASENMQLASEPCSVDSASLGLRQPSARARLHTRTKQDLACLTPLSPRPGTNSGAGDLPRALSRLTRSARALGRS